MHFFKKAVDALFIDAFRGFQKIEVHSNGSCEMNEGLHVFRKTKAAKSEARV